jgi:hypothetical protein
MKNDSSKSPPPVSSDRIGHGEHVHVSAPDIPPHIFCVGRLAPLDFYVNLMNVKTDLHSSFHGVKWRKADEREVADSIHILRDVASYCRELERAIRKEASR